MRLDKMICFFGYGDYYSDSGFGLFAGANMTAQRFSSPLFWAASRDDDQKQTGGN